MGRYGHPWLPIPSSGSDLRVTLLKIKIKIRKVKVKHSHSLPHLANHYKSKGVDLSRGIGDPNPDLEKRSASSCEDLETFSGQRALICLIRLLIHIRLNQRPFSFCNALNLETDCLLVLSLSSVTVSILTHLDINSVQSFSV